jgi:Xaa-Pro aminopeptidase
MNAWDGAEHRGRLHAEVLRRGLDGALVYSWERGAVTWFTSYFPGFRTNYAALWLPAKGEPVLGTRHPYEDRRASAVSGLRCVGGIKPIDLVPSECQSVGLVGGDFAVDETPPSLLAALRARGVAAHDLTASVDDWRSVKSASEIDALTYVAEIGELALQAAGTRARQGETDFEIAARVENAARRSGAARVLCLLGIGDGAVVTEARGVRVGAHDPVGLEFTICVDGFWMQVNGTLPPETPRERDRRALHVCHEARRAIVDALVPGASIDDVVAAGDRVLDERGVLAYKEYDFGHGVGADTPEYPWLIGGTGRTVRRGSVITVHVAIRRPEGETAFVGGPVVVDASGARELVPDVSWTVPAI